LRNAKSLRDRGHEVDVVTSRFRPNFRGEKVDEPWVHRIFKLSQARDAWTTSQSFADGSGDLGFRFSKLREQLKLRFTNIMSIVGGMRVADRNERAIEEFVKDRQYDAVYVFGLHFIGTSVLRGFTKRNVPILYHHGDEWLAFYIRPQFLKRIILALSAPMTYRREKEINLDNVYLVSEFMKRRYLEAGFSERQLGVIYRGIEIAPVSLENLQTPRKPVFMMACRLAMYKGIHSVIHAAAKLDRLDPDLPWEVQIAGHGTVEAQRLFDQMIRDHKVEHRVKLIGKLTRDRTVEMMQQSLSVISPSIFDEPFGNTNIEALASGAVLIASDAGAIHEIIEHGRSGLIFERSNIDELVNHMLLILKNDTLRRSLAENGLRRINEMFTQDRIIDQVEAKLSEVANVPFLKVIENDQRISLK
jgi:glycosyltransferase involved in cell wall biosynthesis